MADLAFAPQHNMIAYLEKTENNAEFHQIVDFLTSSSIHHYLTVSPTIYASNIEHFWNTATFQTINDEKQIHAIVDGKIVVITESSVRRGLLFTDANGITCLTTEQIFKNLLLMVVEGEGSGNPPKSQPTPSPAQPINEIQILKSSSSPQNTQSPRQTLEGTGFPYTKGPNFPDLSVDVEAVHKEGSDSLVRAATTASLDAQQNSSNITKTQSKATLNEPTPQGECLGSGLGCQETMGGAMAQIRFEGALIQSIDLPLSTGYTVRSGEDRMEHGIELMDHVPQTPHDSPLSGGHTPGSDEGSMTLKELTDFCTTLLQKVLDLENVKTAQAKEIASLKKRVTKLEQRQSSRISSFHPFRAGTSKRHSLGRRKVSKQERKNLKSQQMFQDIDDVLDEDADTKMIVKDKGNGEKGGSTSETISTARPDISAARPEKAEKKGITFKDADNFARLIRSITILQPLLIINPKDKGKGILQKPEPIKKTKKKDQDQIDRDVEVALKIQAHLDKEAMTERERQEEASKATLAKMYDEFQAQIDVDHELVVRLAHEEQEKYTVEVRSKLLAEFFERRKKQLAKEKAEAIRSKPPIETQLRNLMMTYLKHTDRFTHAQLKSRSFEEIQKLYIKEQKWVDAFVPIGSEKDEKRIESRKKRAAEHRKCLKVVPDDDKPIDYETLYVKSPNVYYESQVLGTNEEDDVHVYKLTRLDESYRHFLTFSRMLEVLDRQDVLDLHKIIMERFPANNLEEMLKKFGLEDSKPKKTPMSLNTKLTKEEECELVDSTKYRDMICSLLYLTASRPDTMFSVCLCAFFQEDPKTSHLEAVKRIFRYIKGTTHLGLWYPKGAGIETVVSADSDHARRMWTKRELASFVRLWDIVEYLGSRRNRQLFLYPLPKSNTSMFCHAGFECLLEINEQIVPRFILELSNHLYVLYDRVMYPLAA
nr:uncharacterized mitochondrial protein AtMg00810-like [Tanacetum cinerariifolium]